MAADEMRPRLAGLDREQVEDRADDLGCQSVAEYLRVLVRNDLQAAEAEG